MEQKPQYNLNNPSIKRIMREMKEMEKEKNSQFTATPLEDNLFEWHFTIRGPKDTEFEEGIYHGRILLPSEYPFKPPNIVLLTPNGRFEVGKKICLSISAYHPDNWQPSWSIRTVLVALIGFMPTKGDGALGALDYTPEERKEMAKKSVTWECDRCRSHNGTALLPDDDITTTTTTTTTTTSFEDLPSIKPETPSHQNTMYESKADKKEQESTKSNSPTSTESKTQLDEDNSTGDFLSPYDYRPIKPQNFENLDAEQTHVNIVQSREDQILDYIITAILFSILGLLLKKFFW